MSLETAGVWAVGVWDTTVYADGVWREGTYVPSTSELPGASGMTPEEWYTRRRYLWQMNRYRRGR